MATALLSMFTAAAAAGTTAAAAAGTTAASIAAGASAAGAFGSAAWGNALLFGNGLSAAATTAAGAAAAGAASTGLTFGSLLSMGLTGAGAFGSIASGIQQGRAYEFQAQQQKLQANQTRIAALDEQNRIRKNFIADLSSANAVFASKGVLAGAGSAEAAIREGARNATADIERSRFGGDVGFAQGMAQAAQTRLEGKSARTSGYIGAAKGIAGNKELLSLLT